MPVDVPSVVRRLCLLASLSIAGAALPASASAAVSLESVGSFANPIHVISPPGDLGRLLVVERGGQVRLVKDGAPQSTPFLDISNLVSEVGEGGLLSIALAPDYATSGRLYAFYTRDNGGTDACSSSFTDADVCPPIRVDEYRSAGAGADTASAVTRRQVMEIPHPYFVNHYGGQLQFDAGGRLYVSAGDGGARGDPFGNAQNGATLLGKILRIDPRQSGGAPYTVPRDNPFNGIGGVRPELWAYGLRNPFRFSLDRQTGDMLIGDVGQNRLEEVDFHPRAQGAGRGRNFGWKTCEGTLRYPIDERPCPLSGGTYVGPIHQYPNASPCRSITGGYVVRDASLEELAGRYLYADYCTGEVRRLNVPGGGGDALVLNRPPFNVASFGEDACGRVYVAELGTGVVSRLTDGTSSCTAALALPPAPPSTLGFVEPPPPGPRYPVAATPDLRSPLLGLRAGSRQRPSRNRGVIAHVRCDEPCSYRAGGHLSIRRAGRRIALRQRTGALAANTTARLRLRLSSTSTRALRRALRRGRRVRARVEARVRDRSGNLTTSSRLLRLTR